MIEEITANVAELKKMSGSNNIAGRLEVTEKLSQNSYYLATLVGESYEEKNSTEYFWKSAISTYMATTEGPISKNEAVAKHTYKDLYKAHMDADSKYTRLKLLLSQVQVIIETERQSISFLKQELRHAIN